MAAAAIGAGAEIRTAARVERIIVRDERVAGVLVDGQEIPAAAMLSSGGSEDDLSRSVRSHRPHAGLPRRSATTERGEPWPRSISRSPRSRRSRGVTDASMLTGHIHIGPDLDYIERAFDHAKCGEVSDAPWLDITVPSVLDAELTPAGGHVMSVRTLRSVLLRGTDWSSMRQMLLTRVIKTLEDHAPGLSSTIVAASIITPAEMHSDYGFSGGHIFHGELSADQLYAMRPLLGMGRYETPVRGVFLCGASTTRADSCPASTVVWRHSIC